MGAFEDWQAVITVKKLTQFRRSTMQLIALETGLALTLGLVLTALGFYGVQIMLGMLCALAGLTWQTLYSLKPAVGSQAYQHMVGGLVRKWLLSIVLLVAVLKHLPQHHVAVTLLAYAATMTLHAAVMGFWHKRSA